MADCEIEISGRDGGYWVSVRSAAGEPDPVSVAFPFDERALAHQLQAVELALLRSSARRRRLTTEEERPAQELGRRLFEFVLPPPLQGYFIAACQGAAEREQPLVVRLRVRPPELAVLPWEFLYDPSQDDYLALRSPLVRFLDTPTPHRVLSVRPPLRILAMTASPQGRDPLEVAEEQRRLTEALADLQASGQVELGWVGGQSWWDLQAALDHDSWHVFHFIGHGSFDAHLCEGVLALTDKDGGLKQLPASELARMLAEKHSLRLGVLNSCDGARASATDRFSSTASVLMRRSIPAVVAMQFEVSDQAAIEFARGFYTAIAAQHPVDQAVCRGRRAIKHARQNTLEWATPVLYLRSATGALFTLTDHPALANSLRAPAANRSSTTTSEPAPDLTAPPPQGSSTSPVEQLRLTHRGSMHRVAFSPDGTRLATASRVPSGSGPFRLGERVLLATDVLLAEKISPEDAAELGWEFEAIGLSAQLREVRPRRSLSEIAWLALMSLPLKPFFDKLAEDFADDAYQHLTTLVGKLLHRTKPATDTPRILVLQDSTSGIQIVFESDLPPHAHQQLLSVDLTTIRQGPLRYDRHSGTWRSELDEQHKPVSG